MKNGLRLSLSRRQKFRCIYCRKTVPKRDRTIEHLLPRSCGGEDRRKNYAMACRSCNGQRGNGVMVLDGIPYLKRNGASVDSIIAALAVGKHPLQVIAESGNLIQEDIRLARAYALSRRPIAP